MALAVQASPRGHYRLRDVVRSELVKFLTLRSTAITLGITVAIGLLVTGLVSNAALGRPAPFYLGFDPTQTSLTGMIVAGLSGGVFGALIITGEYSSGTIRTSLSATPRRPVLITAKTGVTAVAVVVLCEILSFASFLLGQAILSGQRVPSAPELLQGGKVQVPLGPGGTSLLSHVRTHASLSSPGALRAVWMTGLFIALLALMSFGLGLIFRSTAGAIASFAGITFVLPLVVRGISEHLDRYVPTNILVNSVMSTQPSQGQFAPLSPPVGLMVMALYAAAALGTGVVLFTRRDA